MILTLIITFILLAIIAFWVYGFILQSDFSVRTKNIKDYKKVLAIFAHPDDEMLTCAGTIGQQGNATLYFLTKGERGNRDAHLDLKLKKIREEEAGKVAKIIGAKKLIHDDFGDGQLDHKKDEIIKRIEHIIKVESPDLIITHDLSGGYGHPDHMTCCEIITQLVQKQFPQIRLWYNSSPEAVQKKVKLPEQMAKDKSYKNKKTSPTHKIFIGLKNINRIRTLYTYKSQYESFCKATPFHPIPMWFFVSMSYYEFFYKVS